MRVESEVDRGSRFIVSIPRGKSHLPADRTEGAPALVSAGARSDAYVEEVLRWLPEEHPTNIPDTEGIARVISPATI